MNQLPKQYIESKKVYQAPNTFRTEPSNLENKNILSISHVVSALTNPVGPPKDIVPELTQEFFDTFPEIVKPPISEQSQSTKTIQVTDTSEEWQVQQSKSQKQKQKQKQKKQNQKKK